MRLPVGLFNGGEPSLVFEARVEQSADAEVEAAAEHADDAVELVAGDPREQGGADVAEQGDAGLLEPHEHGAAVDGVELGEGVGRDSVQMSLAQEVALADGELAERGGERGLQLGAEALAQEVELEVVAGLPLVEQGLARDHRLGSLAGEIDDQPGGGDPNPGLERALPAIAQDLGLTRGLGEDQADQHELRELVGRESQAGALADHPVELGSAGALEPAQRLAVTACTGGGEVEVGDGELAQRGEDRLGRVRLVEAAGEGAGEQLEIGGRSEWEARGQLGVDRLEPRDNAGIVDEGPDRRRESFAQRSHYRGMCSMRA